MTTSDIHIATENTNKSANQAEAPAIKAELATLLPPVKQQDVKVKAPVKATRKPVVKKAVTAPVPIATPAKAPIKVAPAPFAKVVAKAVAKQPAKARTKVVVKAETQKPAKPNVKILVEKVSKQKKPKLVRDSFTIPKPEYLVLDDLKQRSAKIGNSAKKSELLRAGIKALAAMTDAAFKAALNAVPTIKTGRPAKD
jgi:hypothetical protein